MLKGTRTTDGSFYQKGLNSTTFAIEFDTTKTPSASYKLYVDVVSRKGEEKHYIKSFYNVNGYGFMNVPNFYEDSWFTVTVVPINDLYISSYSSL